MIRDDAKKGANEDKFFRDICIYLNTVDYIKETLQSVHDSLNSLLDEPFNDQVDFKSEEDLCVAYLNTFVGIIKNTLDNKLVQIFTNQVLKLPLDKMEENPMNSSPYVENIKSCVSGVIFLVRDKMNSVYFTKLLNSICQSINSKYIETIYKFRRVSEKGGRQLQLDYGEIRRILYDINKNDEGGFYSKFYTTFVNKNCEKPAAIIKILIAGNAEIQPYLSSFANEIPPAEIEKILMLKSFTKKEILSMLNSLSK